MGIQVSCRIIIPCKVLRAVLRYRSHVAVFIICVIGIISIAICYTFEIPVVVCAISICAKHLRTDLRLRNIAEVIIDKRVIETVMGYRIQEILVVGIVVLYSLTV